MGQRTSFVAGPIHICGITRDFLYYSTWTGVTEKKNLIRQMDNYGIRGKTGIRYQPSLIIVHN